MDQAGIVHHEAALALVPLHCGCLVGAQDMIPLGCRMHLVVTQAEFSGFGEAEAEMGTGGKRDLTEPASAVLKPQERCSAVGSWPYSCRPIPKDPVDQIS